MATLAQLTAGQAPVIAYPKTIQFGPVELDGYMLENGEFRQSINSTAAAIGIKNTDITRMFAPRYGQPPLISATSGSPDTLQGNMFGDIDDENAGAVIVPIRAHGTAKAYTINLPMVVEVWKQIALGGGKYARPALELLGLSAVHSLERVYQEAYGVADTRNTNERLLDWAIRLDAGKHFPLFGGLFHKHFARVTGVTIGHRYAMVCLAELVYHRLPEVIYETLKDINPLDEQRGWRQYSHSQLMTDDMHQQMREIVAAVTNQLANTPAKADDPKAYRHLLQRLDKTLPRYKTRGYFGSPKHLQSLTAQG